MDEQTDSFEPCMKAEPNSVVETCLDSDHINGGLSCNNVDTINGGLSCNNVVTTNGGLSCNNVDTINGGLSCNNVDTINGGLSCNNVDTINGGLSSNNVDTINGGLRCNNVDTINGGLSCNNVDTTNGGLSCNNIDTINGGLSCINVDTINGETNCNNVDTVNGGTQCNNLEAVHNSLNCYKTEPVNGKTHCYNAETVNGGVDFNITENADSGLNCNNMETPNGGINCNNTETNSGELNCNNSELNCGGRDFIKSDLVIGGNICDETALDKGRLNCKEDKLVVGEINYENSETVNGSITSINADSVNGEISSERSDLVQSGNHCSKEKLVNGGGNDKESDSVKDGMTCKNWDDLIGQLKRRKIDLEHCTCGNANDAQEVERNRTDVHVCKKEQPGEVMSNFMNEILMPLILMIAMPHFMIILWYTVAHCGGSYLKLVSVLTEKSPFVGMSNILRLVNCPSPFIIGSLIVYCVYALAMMKLLPGKTVYGPVTPKGNIPVYKENGFVFFVLTMGLFWTLTLVLRPFGITPSIYYDKLDEIIVALNVFSLIFCLILYIKGKVAPSTSDSGSSGNIVFDYYWGMELYPRIYGFDVKVFTNCRFGLMIWALMVCIHAVKSYELYGFVDSMFVSALLQIIYLAKFYWWESGYYSTIDIMVDRAGFYICWGCMVFVPVLYTSVTCYLVSHPVRLGLTLSAALVFTGLFSIYANYEADAQKQNVRTTNGQCLIWGRKPDIIRAKYHLGNGGDKESILLASGWWGMSRHFHYVPEITQALLWSLPAMFENLMPYTYVIFLVILLTHRSLRDEKKCSMKYGEYWQEYCKKVPYRMVPYVF